MKRIRYEQFILKKLELLDSQLKRQQLHIEALEDYLKLKSAYNPNFQVFQFKDLSQLTEDGGMTKPHGREDISKIRPSP